MRERASSGRAHRTLGLLRDITDERRIAGELSTNRAFLDLAAQNIQIAFADTTPSRLAVKADYMRLMQVLVNLTSNAIKYNREHGAVSFRLSITEDGYGRIGVSDTGQGIPDNRRNAVFQSFNRLGPKRAEKRGLV